MGFFSPGELVAPVPDRTVWVSTKYIKVRGCERAVELECRWLYNDDWLANFRNASLRALEGVAAMTAEIDAIARHVVVGWRNVPETYGSTNDAPFDVDGCIEILTAFRRAVIESKDGKNAAPWRDFTSALGKASDFGAQLVDAGDLGNE